MNRVFTFYLIDNSLPFFNLPFATFTHRSLNLSHVRYYKFIIIRNSYQFILIKGIIYLKPKPFNIQSVVSVKKLKQ